MSDEPDLDEIKKKEEELLRELKEFEHEREKLKRILGQVGGHNFSRKDTWINLIFLVVILLLFVSEATTHFLPSFLSLEIGILLVSIKIVFMIHSQQKVNHFQFWILNSIEYRMNDVMKRVRKVEKQIDDAEGVLGGAVKTG
jgi:hypothetical protein